MAERGSTAGLFPISLEPEGSPVTRAWVPTGQDTRDSDSDHMPLKKLYRALLNKPSRNTPIYIQVVSLSSSDRQGTILPISSF